MPELAGRYPVRSLGGREISPLSGARAPARQRSSVLFPAPSPPTTAVTWPAGTDSVTSASATVLPYRTQTAVAPQAAWAASARAVSVMAAGPVTPEPDWARPTAGAGRALGPQARGSCGTGASRR